MLTYQAKIVLKLISNIHHINHALEVVLTSETDVMHDARVTRRVPCGVEHIILVVHKEFKGCDVVLAQ